MKTQSWWATLQDSRRRRVAAWIKRRQGTDALPVALHRRRIYIVPGRTGAGFAALVAIMLIAGLNYANSIALFLAFLLAALALVSMHACHRNLLRLRLEHLDIEPAYAGTQATVRLTLAEDSSLPRTGIQVDGPGLTPASCDLPARENHPLALLLATPRRGLQPLERMRISTTFPLGLFRAWTWLHLPLSVLVYPAPAGLRPMPSAQGQQAGTVSHGLDADEWSGLRPFRSGDSPRQVSWTAYARGAPLMTKEFSATGGGERQFDFTTLADLPLEQRLSQLAQWITDAEVLGQHYTLRLPGVQVETGAGAAHRHRCLEALALYGLQPAAGATTAAVHR